LENAVSVFGEFVSLGSAIFLLLALALALSFEFVNGFHDTANAVATVIYTHTLRPGVAVIWSGCWNLIGVLLSGGAVAFSVVSLLPAELVLNVGSAAGFAMVFSLLLSAMIWNVGTWYFGLPASSSHALIGSIMGVGFANSVLAGGRPFGEGVDWTKATEVGTSLLVSPVVGFCGAAALLLLAKSLIKHKELYLAPDKEKAPPTWIRCLLILTCTGVSFGHGSNDGQKGMGLIMLILIGVLPTVYALNLSLSPSAINELASSADKVAVYMDQRAQEDNFVRPMDATEVVSSYIRSGQLTDRTFTAMGIKSRGISRLLSGNTSLTTLTSEERRTLRSDLYLTSEALGKMMRAKVLTDSLQLDAAEFRTRMDRFTKFIPYWVKVAVALALGLGTTIGWKRIVVTVGEKIGKEHLTYAQGAAAELVAAGTILAADRYGLPVSTTHVLSSGVAGTMAANRSGLQSSTLRNLLLAWVLTLPVTVLLGAGIFAFAVNVLIRFGIA
jgi:inorganic phosphate transporter, PiT family